MKKPNRKPHRIHSRNDGAAPYWDGVSVAAAALGVSRELLARAKKLGCPLFRSGRVYKDGLTAWLDEHKAELESAAKSQADSGGDLKGKKIIQEIRKLTLLNDRTEKVLISRARVEEAHKITAATIIAILRQKIEQELPASVAGLDVPSARIVCKNFIDAIIGEVQKLEVHWDF